MVKKNKKSKRIAGKSASVVKKAISKVLPIQKIKQSASPTRLSIYIYWFIILFFICATFYIIGRSQEILKKSNPTDNVEIIDSMATMDNANRKEMAVKYAESGKDKLLSGDPTSAIYDLSISIEADSSVSETYIFRGEAYMQNADYSNAMSDMNIALRINPDSAIGYYDRALLSAKLENYVAALSDLGSALTAYQKYPNDILNVETIYAKRAQLNLWVKNWSAAVGDYTSAVSGNAGRADYYSGRAEAYTALGEYNNALKDYMTAARVVSENIQSVSSVSEREGVSRDAMTYFEKAGAIRISMGDINGAASDLESAHMIAVALGDTERADRLKVLIMNIK